MEEDESKELRNIWHGAYGEWTPYDIVQHQYISSDCEDERQGYLEVLEIRDAPETHNKFVIHEFWNATGSIVYEFTSLEDAKANTNCVRITRFGADRPWFYLEPQTS